ncbi:MAG: endolytic transglycosylase MltG, partial [Spongiibacteraceae bacterium]
NISSPLSVSPEGLFFPDSYEYIRGDSNVEILRRSYKRLTDILMDEWQGRDTSVPYSNPYEALIMASIVERETGAPEERAMIAGVFVRRLKMGMRLQTDPTIIYGLGERYDGNLRKSHLLDATNRYNTYQHHGLPPTPIALVGREAIHAALHPADSKNLYFVAKGDGSHRFSATLDAHEAAVREFQINKRKRNYRSAPK